jgi:PAS domain S-box-containing protein
MNSEVALSEWTIKRKLTLIIMATSVFALVLASVAIVIYQVYDQRAAMLCELSVHGEITGRICAATLDFDDPASAEKILGHFWKKDSILFAGIYDNAGDIFAEYLREDLPESYSVPHVQEDGYAYTRDALVLFAPSINKAGDRLGTICLKSDLKQLYDFIWRSALAVGIMTLLASVVAFLISARLQRLISDPITELVSTTEVVTLEQNYAVRARKHSDDELGRLTDAFNEMLGQIQTRDEALRKERDYSTGIVEGSPALICGIAPNGETAFMNPAGERITGYSAAELIGTNWWDVFYPGAEHRQVDVLLLELEKGDIQDYEMSLTDRNGRAHIISWNTLTRYDEAGQVSEIVGFGSDITARKMAEKERKRLANILENTSDMVSMARPDASIVYMNRAGRKMVGWSEDDDLSTRKIADVHPLWATRLVIEQGIPAGVAHGHWQSETALLNPQGHEFPVSQVLMSHMDAQGNLEYLSTIMRDISERKHAEEEMSKLRNYLKNIVDSMPSILVGVDQEGRVTQWNREAERTTGVSVEGATGKLLQDVLPQLQMEMGKIRQAIRSRQVQAEMKVSTEVEGEKRFADVTVFPLVANGVEGAVIRVDDVTDRVRIEEMMIQSEKMLSVGGLAAGMAHEINNPLAGILQNVQVMRNRLSSELPKNKKIAEECGVTIEDIVSYMKRRDIFTMIESVILSGKRAAKIVDNMLSFSRKGESKQNSVNMEELLESTLELASNDYDLKKKYDFRQIEIEREYEQDSPLVICESSKIQQVLLNILKNGAQAMADKFEEDGNFQPCFTLRVMNEDGKGRIEIEDNGPGMDDSTRRRVFEPFFTTKEIGVGTGLGLSVSYFIVTENHNGTMHVESKLGEGTNFVICLPGQLDSD